MKKVYGALLLFLSTFSFSQQYAVSVSEQMQYGGALPLKLGEEYISLEADAKMQFGLTFKLNKVKYSIALSKYDSRMHLVKEAKLSNGERVYGPFKAMLKNISGKLYLFYYQLAEDNEQVKLFASEVNSEDLSLHAPVELLSIEQKNVGLHQAMELLGGHHFAFVFSPDKSKSLALWSAGINNRFFCTVFDKGFKKLRAINETIDGERAVSVNNACIDNEGNVLVSLNTGKKTHILSNSANGKTVNQEIVLPSGSPYEAFVFPSGNGGAAFTIAGTYKEGKDGITGVFQQQVKGNNFRLGNAVKSPFPQVLVEQCNSDGWASTKAKSYGLSKINFRPYLLPDGSVNLLGEFRRIETGTRTLFEVAGNIINVRFKGESVVCSRIPKIRVSAGSNLADSYRAVPFNNNIVIFYNDHASNLKNDISASPDRSDNYRKDVLVAATIQNDNTIKREIVLDLTQQDFLPVAEDLQPLSSASVLIPIRRIKGFGKVTEDFKWGTITIQ